MDRKQPIQKIVGVLLSKSMSKQKDGSLLVRGFFTSDNKDEMGDIITRAATERAIPKYRQWSNIRYMHLPRPVGKVNRIGAEDGLEWNEVEIKVIDPQAVFEVENGLLAALSIGALISLEDVEFLEDGGMLINDYTLAEISLVDHPANYDARLKNLTLEQGLQAMVSNFGMDALARSMKSLIETEMSMSDQTPEKTADLDATVTEPEVKPVPETEVVEEQKDVAAPEEAPVEEEVAPEPAPETEEVTKEISNDEIVTMLKSLAETVEKLSSEFAEFAKSFAPHAEAPAEQEQAGGAPDAEKAAGMEPGLDTEPEAGPGVNREKSMEGTVLPGDGDVSEQKGEAVTDLRQALLKYFQNR